MVSQRNKQVEEALSWAFSNGYYLGKLACEEYAKMVNCELVEVDGGNYPNWYAFKDKEAKP